MKSIDNIVLYSNGCPRCKILKSKLDAKDIQYTENSSVDEMLALGITNVPVLSLNGELMEFGEAVKWVNNK